MRNLTIGDQEVEGNCDFSKATLVCTAGLQMVFGENTALIIDAAINLITATYGNRADYLQVFNWSNGINVVKFWIVYDRVGSGIATALLPEDY